jgi:hypothetical protein
MKLNILFEFAAPLTLVLLTSGCLIDYDYLGHHPPPLRPSGPPAVVVASTPPAPRAVPERWVDVSITVQERQVIREYVIANSDDGRHGRKGRREKSLPPGLARKVARGENLPPGWQKKLVRGETLPAEVYHECRPLPDEVIVRLPPPPTGTITVTIEGKIVRLMRATMEILDVFDVPL